MRKTLLVFLNLIAYTVAEDTTEAFECKDGCEEYTVANADLQGNLTALAALEDAVTACEAEQAAKEAAETSEDAGDEEDEGESEETETEDEGTKNQAGGNGGEQQKRILKFKTQLSGDADPCQAQIDDLAANSTALQTAIDGVNNVGLTSDSIDHIETQLKAQKRLFLLSKVMPNAEVGAYETFMNELITQEGHWDHAHDEDEQQAEGWGLRKKDAQDANNTEEVEVDENEETAENDRTKADALAAAGIKSFVTYINDTIVQPAATFNVSGDATEPLAAIDHANGYQGAYLTYLNEAEKATVATLNALISTMEDGDDKTALQAFATFMEGEQEKAEETLQAHIAANEEGGSMMWILIVGAVVIVGGFAVWWFFCRNKDKKD